MTGQRSNHKHVGPGEFTFEVEGKPGRYKATETARSLDAQLNVTIGLVTGQLTDDSPRDLEQARLDDTKTAIAALATGDLSNIQQRLAAQAIATETSFHNLLQTGSVLLGTGDAMAFERGMEYVRQAVKFQDQSRKTLVALAEVRNPKRSTFVKNQQNNLLVADTMPQPNQLGEAYGSEMESGTTGRPKAAMPKASTVGVQHGALDAGRKGQEFDEFLQDRDLCSRRADRRGEGVTSRN
jgi:hypothetical protein